MRTAVIGGYGLGWPLESAPFAGKNRGLSPVLTLGVAEAGLG
jgi:hypothetical protein